MKSLDCLHRIMIGLVLLSACQTTSQLIATGEFVNKGGQQTSGSYQIVQRGDQQVLILSDNFQTDEGPDLHLILTPVETAAAENENVMAEGNGLVIAPLKALSGQQEYKIPAGTSLEQYQSVAIHCIEFTHLYGAAPL